MSEAPSLAAELTIGPVRLRNRVLLAPMSGITDGPFRKRAFAHGAGLVVSEMVASGELAKGHRDTMRRIRDCGHGPLVVQLAGREAGPLAEAARIAEGEGAAIVDINMGCPAKKVTGGYAGSALMRDLDQAVALIAAVVGAVSVPVTVKMRLGWDDQGRNAPELARRAEQAGVLLVTVHGRTRCQFYTGRADWAAIRAVKQAVSIPVVANGDVDSPDAAQSILSQSGADAVMVGRAAFGAPWLPGRLAAGTASAMGEPADIDIAGYVAAHHEDMMQFYGIASGLRQARKHLGWYLDRHAPATPPDLRQRLLRAEEPREVGRLIAEAFAAPAPARVAA